MYLYLFSAPIRQLINLHEFIKTPIETIGQTTETTKSPLVLSSIKFPSTASIQDQPFTDRGRLQNATDHVNESPSRTALLSISGSQPQQQQQQPTASITELVHMFHHHRHMTFVVNRFLLLGATFSNFQFCPAPTRNRTILRTELQLLSTFVELNIPQRQQQ